MGGNDNWWGTTPFGGSDIDFATGFPSIHVQNRTIDLYHTTANITDANGDLLFFTNGVVIGNALGDTMFNGTGLNPSDYTNNWYPDGLLLYQSHIIIPKPNSSDQYYLIHNTIDNIQLFTAQYLYVTEVDMSLNGSWGSVTAKNQVLFTGNLQNGHLTAVRHGNGRDWWLYAHEHGTNVFHRWLIGPQGIQGPVSQSTGVIRPPDAGQVVFSQDGAKFAYFTSETGLDVFEVDRCDGSFVHLGHADINNSILGIGASFSPNSKYLYLSSLDIVYQLNTEASNFQSGLIQIAEWDSTYSPSYPFATVFGASKLAPDGKIYISTMNGTDKLHVIDHPDSAGLACDLVQNGVTLPTYWKNSLPNHPNYHLGPLVGSVCDSLGLGIDETNIDLNLSLYPNPNAGAFTINFAPQPEAGTLHVHDVNGRLVHTDKVAPWSQLKRMQLHDLRPGVYQCRLSFGRSTAVQRFVVE